MTTTRDSRGRFRPGQSGNPSGRPRTASHYRKLLTGQVTDTALVQVVNTLLAKAVEGDVSACKLVLEYCIGKPVPVDVGPDTADLTDGELAGLTVEELNEYRKRILSDLLQDGEGRRALDQMAHLDFGKEREPGHLSDDELERQIAKLEGAPDRET
jgi:hypothetical protein